jgi:hypothetical protein
MVNIVTAEFSPIVQQKKEIYNNNSVYEKSPGIYAEGNP